jgi:alkanesulfonate monooxygenase SsuD/methylene tetrahydromethanopterin reductase-like flavin-dependent oxidoreductase (luciferase family)
MKYGFVFPGGTVHEALEFGQAAEQAGWDGFFVWDPVWGLDAWVTLAAVAMRTERIRLGTMITPVSRRRPWKLAGEAATLDQLSGGRVILAVGLGAVDTGFEQFGEVTDRKQRAELLDEGLDIITGLWAGQPFNYTGKHYTVRETTFAVPQPPVQKPRIPIWVVGAWPRARSMRRALRYDGLLPAHMVAQGKFEPVTPEVLREISAYAAQHRAGDGPYDIIVEGETPGDDAQEAASIVTPLAEAGATWWLEAMWTAPTLDHVRERLRQGPPAV